VYAVDGTALSLISVGSGRFRGFGTDERACPNRFRPTIGHVASGFAIRPYRDTDERGWLVCRVLSFLDSAFFDDVRQAKECYERYRRKAVEAARSLARAVRYTDSAAGGLQVGIGVASGQEFVGNVGGGGYKDFTAVGDVTNTAARLTSVARDGEIIVDAPTYDAVARAYPDAERQQLMLKGKRTPVDVFRIPP
jgi:class 3 adenylate cyclase